MAQPIDANALSLTGGGSALLTDAHGAIHADAVEGLLVEDVRVLSTWRVEVPDAELRFVGRERTGPSSDRLLFTVGLPGTIDPVAMLQRDRVVDATGLCEHIALTAYSQPFEGRLQIVAQRDDATMYEIPLPSSALAAQSPSEASADGEFSLGQGVVIRAGDMRCEHGLLHAELAAKAGETWGCELQVAVAGRHAVSPPASAWTIATSPPALASLVAAAHHDRQALTIEVEGRRLLAAGSPYFLALFGRDSLIAGLQSLLDGPGLLLDTLRVLASHQATAVDERTRAQPGRIAHEMRLGKAGVFGLPAGEPYYGTIDAAPLFVDSLATCMRWGASKADVVELLPAAQAALRWCAEYGDVDGDGFVESVPDASGITNQGWKDSGDSVIDGVGRVVVDHVSLCEVQAYWYRALRSMAELERWLGVGDGAAHDAQADALRAAFVRRFVYDTDDGPFVGLGLAGVPPAKQLLQVKSSNAGHVLWSGILPDALAASVAAQLVAPDMFSGWGVRTISSSAPGYNPFSYHRGSVWPHDTAFAMHGAARYGFRHEVVTLAGGLVDLGVAAAGQLPELISGVGRSDSSMPVPYLASCRPQAWAAGVPAVVVMSLLGLEPDVPNGVLRVNPMAPEGLTIEVRNIRIGEHHVSVRVSGADVSVDAPGLHVTIG
jgi:hypothetical protein